MTFNTSYIINDKLKTTENIGSELVYAIRTDSFAPKESETLLTTTEPVIIETIDWLPRNETNARIFIHIIDTHGEIINSFGVGTQNSVTPKDVLEGLSLYFDVIQYDTTITPDPIMRFHLKKPLYCPKGIIITVSNTDTEKTFRNSCQIVGRKLT